MSSAQRLRLWQLALLAFGTMCGQDVLATVMVIFESRLNAPVAGAFDVAGWLFGIVTTFVAVDSVLKEGWCSVRALTVVAAVSLANFAGTWLGVVVGAAITTHPHH